MTNSIATVVDQHLCTQCGTCVAVCPVDAIDMRETPSGLLLPFVVEEECIECGSCLEICPGSSLELDLPESVDPFKGPVCAAYIGHASDEEVRSTGQSGGLVSAILLFLLETGQVNAALVSTMPRDGTLRPKPILARTRQEILSAQGSKYCPLAANTALKDIATDDRIAAVGISCQMHGLHMLNHCTDDLADNIQYRIGLFCDRTMLYTCIDLMAENAKLARTEIVGLEYRSKTRNGWPGEVCFHLNSGRSRFFPSSLRTGLKDYFTAPRCRLCFDKMNVLADLSVGDAWGMSNLSGKGDSVVLARNARGAALLENACDSGFLKLKPVAAELIFKKHKVELRRRSFVAYSEVWREMGRDLPEHTDMNPDFLAPLDPQKSKFRRNLLLNCRIAESETKQSALAAARGRQSSDRVKSMVTRPLRGLNGRLKRLLRLG